MNGWSSVAKCYSLYWFLCYCFALLWSLKPSELHWHIKPFCLCVQVFSTYLFLQLTWQYGTCRAAWSRANRKEPGQVALPTCTPTIIEATPLALILEATLTQLPQRQHSSLWFWNTNFCQLVSLSSMFPLTQRLQQPDKQSSNRHWPSILQWYVWQLNI